MKKKSIIIIAAVLLLAAVIAVSFITGRKTAPEGGIAPSITIEEFRPADPTIDKYVREYRAGGSIDPAYLTKCYGINEAKAKDFFENPGNWLCYDAYITISNSSDKDCYFFGVNCDENGKDGVYVFAETTSILGIPSGGKNQICISVLADNSDLSDAEVEKRLRAMPLYVAYSENDDPAATDFSRANLK